MLDESAHQASLQVHAIRWSVGAVLSIGDHVLQSVIDTIVEAPPTRLYPSTTDAMWGRHADLLQPEGRLRFGIGAYVLHTGDRLALIDLGVGPNGWQAPSGAVMPPGHLLERLRELGVEPADVTDVVFTHLHPDHVGWASAEGEPVFAHATYRCHRRDWEHFVGHRLGDPAVWSVLDPVVERLETWDADTGTLFPGVDLLDAPGHTPGSTVMTLSAPNGERAVLLGDVVHCPVELLDDHWESIGDVDPELAMRTRARIARELEDGTAHVSAAHFPELQFGRLVVDTERGRRWGYTV